MTTTQNLEHFFNQYEDIIQTGLEYDYSEKEIYNAIYSKEFNNYLRKGIHPRLDELNHTINFIKMYRSGKLNTKDNSNQVDKETSKMQNIRDFTITLDPNNEDDNYKIKNRMQGIIAKLRTKDITLSMNYEKNTIKEVDPNKSLKKTCKEVCIIF